MFSKFGISIAVFILQHPEATLSFDCAITIEFGMDMFSEF